MSTLTYAECPEHGDTLICAGPRDGHDFCTHLKCEVYGCSYEVRS